MNYRFDVIKTTQAAVYLMNKYGGEIEYMKLIKLLYLANRESFKRYGEPIAPDYFVSMKHGPVLSSVLNEINDPERSSYWSRHISPANDYKISVIAQSSFDELNGRSVKILDEVDKRWHDVEKWAMVDWMHENLPEWRDPGDSSLPIHVEDILVQVGLSQEEITARLCEETAFSKEREHLLNGARSG